MTSIKEALKTFARFADPHRKIPRDFAITQGSGFAKHQLTMGDCYVARAALAQLESADARERIARIIDPEAMIKSKPIHGYYPSISIKNRIDDALAKADAILATGLVPDEATPSQRTILSSDCIDPDIEAAIRADEREKCAKVAYVEAAKHCSARDGMTLIGHPVGQCIAAAIRAGRAE